MESEVAATLCAAYPEVDPSVVALVLAETGGDAGEAARQLAVLVSDTHNQLAGEPRPRCGPKQPWALLCAALLTHPRGGSTQLPGGAS